MCQEEKMTPQHTNKMFGKRRAVSPILATVILLGITVVGGGLAYSLMAQGSNAASSQNIITLENAQAVKGTSHADLTATIKNGGSKPWKTVEMTVAKSDLAEPILYEALHENVMGCKTGTCNNGASGGTIEGKIDNPLRSQWLAHLDISGGTANVVDKGEGISAGRKFVISTSESSYRDTLVPNGTALAKLMTSTVTNNNIDNALEGTVTSTSYVNVGALFKALDPSVDGDIWCKRVNADASDGITCKVFTHQKISAPISPGQSVQIYADAFTKDVPGLNNQKVQSGDALVVNIVATAEDGSTARYQTVIKVTGI
jgi:flagellin-like protein